MVEIVLLLLPDPFNWNNGSNNIINVMRFHCTLGFVGVDGLGLEVTTVARK